MLPPQRRPCRSCDDASPKSEGEKSFPCGARVPAPWDRGQKGSWVPGGHRCPWLGVSVMLTLSPLCHRFAPTFPEAVILPSGDVAFGELLEAGKGAACFVWAVGIPALAQDGAFSMSPQGFARMEPQGFPNSPFLAPIWCFFPASRALGSLLGKRPGLSAGMPGAGEALERMCRARARPNAARFRCCSASVFGAGWVRAGDRAPCERRCCSVSPGHVAVTWRWRFCCWISSASGHLLGLNPAFSVNAGGLVLSFC